MSSGCRSSPTKSRNYSSRNSNNHSRGGYENESSERESGEEGEGEMEGVGEGEGGSDSEDERNDEAIRDRDRYYLQNSACVMYLSRNVRTLFAPMSNTKHLVFNLDEVTCTDSKAKIHLARGS